MINTEKLINSQRQRVLFSK